MMDQIEWNGLSAAEKKRQLYFRQRETLNQFLEHGAISQEQYAKSLGDLTIKMGMESEECQDNQ